MKTENKLRSYQQDCVTAIITAIAAKVRLKALVILPTGAGKSYVIAGVAMEYDGPILVLQPTKELLEQNLEKFQLLGGEASVYSASFNSKEVGHITFGTLGSVIKAIDEFKDLKDLLIICDEAHFKYDPKPGSQFRQFLSGVKPQHIVGLTATPFRLINSLAGASLKMINRTNPRVFSDILYVQQIPDIIEKGFWAPSLDERWTFDSELLELNSSGSDYTDSSIKSANEENDTNRSIAIRLLELLKEGKRKSILVFTDSVESAEIFTEYFKQYTTTKMVMGKTPKKERNRTIQGFKEGTINLIFNYDCLAIGFDHPALDTIIMGRATNSLAKLYQIYGRGCRTFPGKDDFLFIDACDVMGRMCHPREIVIEDHPTLGWGVFAGERVITNVPLGFPIYKKDLIEVNKPQEDLGAFPFGKWKGRKIEDACKYDLRYVKYMVEQIDDAQYGPGLKNRLKEGIRRSILKNLHK